MTDLATVVEIVRSQEAEEVKNAVVFTLLMLGVSVPCAVWLVRRFRRVGVSMCVMFFFALALMATKRPRVEWDDYLSDAGTEYATNSVGAVTGVSFRWTKTEPLMPGSTPVYVSKSPTNEENYAVCAVTAAGALAYGLTVNDAAGYKYMVWHNWIPPSPSHTNGTWVGYVLDKAMGTVGTDKLVIINGQLLENGKVIAPCVK